MGNVQVLHKVRNGTNHSSSVSLAQHNICACKSRGCGRMVEPQTFSIGTSNPSDEMDEDKRGRKRHNDNFDPNSKKTKGVQFNFDKPTQSTEPPSSISEPPFSSEPEAEITYSGPDKLSPKPINAQKNTK